MSAALAEDDLFNAARRLADPAERTAFLRSACGADEPLRARVEALLAAHDEAGNPLDRSLAFDQALPGAAGAGGQPTQLGSRSIAEAPGATIGAYKLLQEIGQGGFGVVFMAEQQHPVRRKVALKVIKPGMDTREVVARFESERQALALMDHPNIAKVLDGGATPSGRPYFVMELVKGIPITKYCDEHRLTPRQRLDLFVPVCRAVQHAHAKGVIHRDLKPSNVLVAPYDGRPVPKVIDFGVAKATGGGLTERTLFTGFGSVVGTLEYMSPEQAELNQLDVDTRSDVYSLGVLLYELLTGNTPLDRGRLARAGLAEALRVIREEDPPAPSTRLGTAAALPAIAANRGLEPATLGRAVRGELDWVVMKALEKDRNRRYETANGLARDIEHYLADEPVEAGRPGRLYRLRKLARKHRGPLAAGIVIAVTLVAGTAVATWQAVRATRAETLAETRYQTERAALGETRYAQYIEDLRSAQSAWSNGELPRMAALLARHRPSAGEQDRRGFEWRYLDNLRRSDNEIRSLWGHQGEIHGLAFSADGTQLASAGGDGSVRLWDVAGSAAPLVLLGHADTVVEVAYGPDGRVYSGGLDTVRVWDAETGRDLDRLEEFRGVVFDRFGRKAVYGGPDWKSLVIRDLTAGRPEVTLTGFAGTIWDCSFSPDGRRLAAVGGGNDATVGVWDSDTGQKLLTLQGHTSAALSVAYSPDGGRIATAGRDGKVVIWNSETGHEQRALPSRGFIVHRVAFDPASGRLATGAADGSIRIWDAEAGREVSVLRGHEEAVYDLEFSTDGRLASGGRGGEIRIWDMRRLPAPSVLDSPTTSVVAAAYSTDGRSLASAGSDAVIRIWDVAGRRQRAELAGHGRSVWSVAFSADGRRLVSASWDGTARVWDIDSGRELLSLKGHKGEVLAAAFSPDGRRVASAGRDHTVRLWDAETGRELAVLRGHATDVRWVTFSPDGRRLASSGHNDGTVVVWDLESKRPVRTLSTGSHGAGGVAFSPDGRLLAATAQEAGFATVWDAGTGRERFKLTGHDGHVWFVTFSPDGSRIATGGTDETVRLWDPTTGRELLTLAGHGGGVTALAFRRDGLQLASASLDRSIRLWDAPPETAMTIRNAESSKLTRDR